MSSSLESETDMIAPKQSRQKQKVVIEFLPWREKQLRTYAED